VFLSLRTQIPTSGYRFLSFRVPTPQFNDRKPLPYGYRFLNFRIQILQLKEKDSSAEGKGSSAEGKRFIS
jgi:hypothetical protein